MIYLNGEFMPIEQAKIPVLDRGFIFGDGVYEVVPVYSGHPFRFGEHMRRLRNSMDTIQLKNPYTETEWGRLTHEIVERNGGGDQHRARDNDGPRRSEESPAALPDGDEPRQDERKV